MVKTLGSQERQGHEHRVCSQRPSLTDIREKLEVTARDALFEEDSEAGSMCPPLKSGVEVTPCDSGTGSQEAMLPLPCSLEPLLPASP